MIVMPLIDDLEGIQNADQRSRPRRNRMDEDLKQRLLLTWTERGGPPVQRPTRRSFGTRMMESLGQQLNDQVQLTHDPSGFVYFLDVPLSSIIAAV